GLTFITLAFGITFSVTISKVVARTKESRQIIQDNMDRLKELVSELEYVMNDFANGHFDRQLKTMHNNDEIDQLTIRLNQPITMLGEIISKLVVASTSVSGGSQNLSYSAKNLTKGSTEQASSLQQITASLSNIAERASQNNESAEDSYQLIEQTSKSVEEGNNSMQGLVQSMNEINDNSRKINGVIKTIDEIAFQTNLLALNAAVEAARAGKYGKGFAVVAEEVRNLATRSASAAKNTTDLIESSVKKIQDGVDKSNQTAKFFELIKGDVEKVETIVKNIAESSIEQNTGIGEINNSLSHVNNIVQNNSEIARETASTADELLSLSEQLQSLVKDFNKIS
ncbi:MAG: methyl-accepting chemotaxis protein, partial [Bacteroidales bacterium]|nr:methyl-accepting chemotaxis protein [Bacteroidales bacterium]